jgi:hypothetical protein
MAYSLVPNVRARYFDANGKPLAGGKFYSYVAGTTILIATFIDNNGTPNTNPVILNANGEADIYLADGSYKFVLADTSDVIQWTRDNIVVPYNGVGTGTGDASAWVKYPVTDGQAAADLTGQTIDFASYSSAYYTVEIIRGTTVMATQQISIENLSGVARVSLGVSISEENHGVTFSVSQIGTVAQFRAALDTGAGNGTIKLSRRLIPV